MQPLLKTTLHLIVLAFLIPTQSTKASWYSINNDVEGYVKIAALLGATSGAIYATIQWFSMTPEKAKKTFVEIKLYYDLQIYSKKTIIDFARTFGNRLEALMIKLPYSVPLHRTTSIFSEKMATLTKIKPYLNENDKKEAETLIEKLNVYINVIISCPEYDEEAKRIQPIKEDFSPIIISTK